MNFFDNNIVVTEIKTAVFFPKEKGTPIEKKRTSHGLVWYVDCSAVYRFSTGEVLTCRSGECIYLPKDTVYTAERYPETDSDKRGIYAVNFLTLPDEAQYSPFVIHARGKGEIQALFSKIDRAWRKKEAGYSEECFGILYRIIHALKKEAASYSPKNQILEKLSPALDYIRENFTVESISLSHLARLCNISEPYLRRLFQRAFSVSPAVYMRNLRIAYAKELLRSGDYSVTDAASLSGFNDPAYFAREFKNAVGTTPSDYQKQK